MADKKTTLKKGDTYDVAFDIKGSGIIKIKAEYTGEYGELNDTKFYYFANTNTGVEYSFTLEQLASFKGMAKRYNADTISF
jgi:hypothetical protein